MFSGIFTAFAATVSPKANKATENLLKVVKNKRVSAEKVIQLIQEGANVNAVNNYGKTPLMLAVSNSNPEITRVLIKYGANVNSVDTAEWTPLIFAVSLNSNPEVLQVLIENGADVNAVNKHGSTVLMKAAFKRNSNPDVLRVLIENGANINAVTELPPAKSRWVPFGTPGMRYIFVKAFTQGTLS
jgi:ankyrin repeat protein